MQYKLQSTDHKWTHWPLCRAAPERDVWAEHAPEGGCGARVHGRHGVPEATAAGSRAV